MNRKLTLGYSPYGQYEGNITPFDRVFENTQNIKTKGFAGVDAVIFWGGTDIHPSYYGKGAHYLNGSPPLPSDRDVFEWKAMLFCKHHKIPMIGVCRGAQFLCAFAGGTLVQHVKGHNADHPVDLAEPFHKKHGNKVFVTSTHHQMMYPFGVKHELVAWADRLSDTHEGEDAVDQMPMTKEPEIVYFPTINALAIQGHPEYNWARKEFCELSVDLVQHYLDIDANINAKSPIQVYE